jgi:hypothetical protein
MMMMMETSSTPTLSTSSPSPFTTAAPFPYEDVEDGEGTLPDTQYLRDIKWWRQFTDTPNPEVGVAFKLCVGAVRTGEFSQWADVANYKLPEDNYVEFARALERTTFEEKPYLGTFAMECFDEKNEGAFEPAMRYDPVKKCLTVRLPRALFISLSHSPLD